MHRGLAHVRTEPRGQPLDEIEKHTDRDNFMAAEKAREYGLIDEVIDRMPAVKSVA